MMQRHSLCLLLGGKKVEKVTVSFREELLRLYGERSKLSELILKVDIRDRRDER